MTEKKVFPANRAILVFGLLFLGAHLFFSGFYFKERMLQEDSPFYIVKMVQHGKLLCEHFRYSVFLFQWIPLLALKINVSLGSVTLIYSLAFDFFLLGLFLYTFYFLKNQTGSLMLLFFIGLALGRDFFLPISEYSFGVISSLPLIGVAFRNSIKKDKAKLIYASVIIIISSNFHPISLLAAGFIIGYEFLSAEKQFRKHWAILALIAAIVFILRHYLVPLDEYEKNKMGSYSEALHYFLAPGLIASTKAIIVYFINYFPELICLFFLSLIVLIASRKWILLAATCAFVYFILIFFSIVKGADEKIFWVAEYFILLGIPILLPLSYALIKLKLNNIFIPIALVLSSLICFFRIHQNAPYFKSKISYIERLISNGSSLPEKRYIVDYKNIPREYMANTWPITFQTLLLSSFQSSNNSQSFIATNNINSFDSLIPDPTYFLGPEWGIDMFDYPDNRIKKKYFNLPEKGYRKLTTSQQNFLADSSLFNASKIKIVPLGTRLSLINDSLAYITVKIINTTGIKIPSIPEGNHAMFLSYHIYDLSGKLISWDNLRSPFETDIYGVSICALNIKFNDLRNKEFYMIADIVSENQRWWGIDSKITITE